MKKVLNKVANKLGFSVSKMGDDRQNYPDIKNEEFWQIYALCKPFTMTSIERMFSLYTSVDYVLSSNIEGAFVECGVWRGGSSMLIAKMLSNRKVTDRKIYLYDTYEGMSEPTDNDVSFKGADAKVLLRESEDNKETSVWCLAGLDDVKANLKSTNYKENNISFIKGKVEDTLPQNKPQEKIALLRLDTDWYESTKHELIHLYPDLVERGVLIIDDFGYWQGCQKAVVEYIEEEKISILLNRVDSTGRVAIKMTAIK